METVNTLLTIRAAQAKDVPALTRLCEQLGYPTPEAVIGGRFGEITGHPEHKVLVALNAEAQVLGWIHGYVRRLLMADPHLEIGGLVVDETQRGLGIGEKLLDEIEAWAQNQGVRDIFLRSNITRKDAHRFYEHLGYQHIKTSKSFQKRLAP